MKVAGIMSGTSLDGIDVAVIEIQGRHIRTLAFKSTPYPQAVRDAILAVSNTASHTAAISRLNFELGELYARAAAPLCRRHGAELVGCHGQTIYHESRRNTMQIGEAAVVAERTGLPVVSDFRVRDIAAGGEGAPLVPYVDYLLYRHPRRGRISLNIGGIANITAIPAGASPDAVIAFDTGPGNMVIDGLVREYTRGRQSYDHAGRLADAGTVREDLLRALTADPYYRRTPPKTAGREQYGAEFLARLKASGYRPLDLIATATVFTAATIAVGIERFAPPCQELIVSGGGAHNPQIMGHLAGFLPQLAMATSEDHGISVDGKEAIAFAVLAYETWRRRSSNLPSATGARRAVVLGKISP